MRKNIWIRINKTQLFWLERVAARNRDNGTRSRLIVSTDCQHLHYRLNSAWSLFEQCNHAAGCQQQLCCRAVRHRHGPGAPRRGNELTCLKASPKDIILAFQSRNRFWTWWLRRPWLLMYMAPLVLNNCSQWADSRQWICISQWICSIQWICPAKHISKPVKTIEYTTKTRIPHDADRMLIADCIGAIVVWLPTMCSLGPPVYVYDHCAKEKVHI